MEHKPFNTCETHRHKLKVGLGRVARLYHQQRPTSMHAARSHSLGLEPSRAFQCSSFLGYTVNMLTYWKLWEKPQAHPAPVRKPRRAFMASKQASHLGGEIGKCGKLNKKSLYPLATVLIKDHAGLLAQSHRISGARPMSLESRVVGVHVSGCTVSDWRLKAWGD